MMCLRLHTSELLAYELSVLKSYLSSLKLLSSIYVVDDRRPSLMGLVLKFILGSTQINPRITWREIIMAWFVKSFMDSLTRWFAGSQEA